MSKKQLTRIYISAAFILAAALAIAAKGGSDKVESKEDKALWLAMMWFVDQYYFEGVGP